MFEKRDLHTRRKGLQNKIEKLYERKDLLAVHF